MQTDPNPAWRKIAVCRDPEELTCIEEPMKCLRDVTYGQLYESVEGDECK